MANNGGRAFPLNTSNVSNPMTELPQWAVEEADALAAVAMETLLSMSDETVEDRGIWLAGFIARALADAMLAAREEGA